MKEHKKYLSIFAALLLAVFAIVCVFGVACNKDKGDDEEPEPTPEVTVDHTHDYEASWDWGTDYSCSVTLTCTSTDGECDKPTVTDKATVTSVDTTAATCVGEGVKTYTATYEYDGETYTDTKTETVAALGHVWPAADATENVDWQWESRTDEVVSLVVTCERCEATLLDEEVVYDTDGATILSAEYEVSETLTYKSEYDTANDPAEHAHHYEPTEWNWSDDYSSCTVTLTCKGAIAADTCDAVTITETTTDITSEVTKDATCEGEGEMTYTATFVYGGHTYTDATTDTIEAIGHDYDVETASWEWTVDSNGTATATVTIVCGNDSAHVWAKTQTNIATDEDGVYHASITGPDEVTALTDDYELVEVQKEYHIDFSDAETYEWIGTPATTGDTKYGDFLYLDITEAKEYTTGILTFKSISGQSVNKENDGSMFTSKASSNGTYFEIDLSAFEGLYVSVTVKISSNSDNDNRSLYINTDKSSSSGIKSVTSNNKTDYQTLEYGELISADETLYLTWSNNIRIFTIDIEILDPDDVTSEVRGVTLDKTSLSLYVEETDYLTATVEMTIGDFTGTYEWSSSDDSIARVEGSGNGATVIAVSSGTAIITVKAGGKEATCTVNVREHSTGDEESITLSYVFDNMSNLTTVITTQENSGEKYSFTENSVTAGEVEGSVLTYTSNKDTPGTQQVTVNDVTYTNYMQMNGTTQSSGNRSFKIDLSSYVGQYSSVTIEVIGTCRVNDTTDENGNVTSTTITQILISSSGSNASADSALAATSTSDVTSNYQPGLSLTYSTMLEERSEFYITCTAHARIYAIYITLGEPSENDDDTAEEGNTSSESVEIKVDFSNPSSDVSSQFEKTVDTDEDETADQRAESTVTFDEDEILKLIDDQYKTKIESSVFKTGGKTTSYTPTGETSSVVTNYFAIDLSQYEGATVTISVTFTSNKSISENDSEETIKGYERSLCLSTALTKYDSIASENVLGEIGTSASTADTQTVTWTGTVTEDMYVYILYSDSLYINSIDITISVDEAD